jgi:hypothetical protein
MHLTQIFSHCNPSNISACAWKRNRDPPKCLNMTLDYHRHMCVWSAYMQIKCFNCNAMKMKNVWLHNENKLSGIWERERYKVRVKYTQVHYMCTLDLTIMTILRSVNRHGRTRRGKSASVRWNAFVALRSIWWIFFYLLFYSPLFY